jgi:hypothetical protein
MLNNRMTDQAIYAKVLERTIATGDHAWSGRS